MPTSQTTAQTTLIAASRASYARRAEVRRRLRHSNTDVAAVLGTWGQTHPDLRRLSIMTILSELPGVGPYAAHALLAEADILPTRTLAQLSEPARQRLTALVDP